MDTIGTRQALFYDPSQGTHSLIAFELFASMEKIRDLGNRAANRAETLPETPEVEDIVRTYL